MKLKDLSQRCQHSQIFDIEPNQTTGQSGEERRVERSEEERCHILFIRFELAQVWNIINAFEDKWSSSESTVAVKE
jgi:hypothetical protein